MSSVTVDSRSLVIFPTSFADIHCEERADIIFLLDSSASIRNSAPPPDTDGEPGTADNWQLVTDFIVQVVTGLPVDNGEVRIAALTYGTRVDQDNIIHLGGYQDKDDLIGKLKSLPYIGSNTNTAAALRQMQSMFRESVRDGTRKVAILISDGMSDIDSDDTVVNSRDAKMEDDINIFTLGVTKYANVGELEEVASDPAAYYHFYSSDFQHLNLLLDQLLIRLCTPRPPAVGKVRNATASYIFTINVDQQFPSCHRTQYQHGRVQQPNS